MTHKLLFFYNSVQCIKLCTYFVKFRLELAHFELFPFAVIFLSILHHFLFVCFFAFRLLGSMALIIRQRQSTGPWRRSYNWASPHKRVHRLWCTWIADSAHCAYVSLTSRKRFQLCRSPYCTTSLFINILLHSDCSDSSWLVVGRGLFSHPQIRPVLGIRLTAPWNSHRSSH